MLPPNHPLSRPTRFPSYMGTPPHKLPPHTCVSHFGTFSCRQSLCLLLIRTATPTHFHTIAHVSGLFFPIFPHFPALFFSLLWQISLCTFGVAATFLSFFEFFLPCSIVHLMPICCVVGGELTILWLMFVFRRNEINHGQTIEVGLRNWLAGLFFNSNLNTHIYFTYFPLVFISSLLS